MQMTTARNLVDLFMRHAADMNEILKTIQEEESKDDFFRIRLMVGRIMGSIYSDALYPIMEEHPSVKPDSLK